MIAEKFTDNLIDLILNVKDDSQRYLLIDCNETTYNMQEISLKIWRDRIVV